MGHRVTLPRSARALARTLTRAGRCLTAVLLRGARIYEGVAMVPYRSEIQRRYARQRDAFMVATFSDAIGVPNPVDFYTLELLPYLLEDFHEWHRRAGLERTPEGGWRCC